MVYLNDIRRSSDPDPDLELISGPTRLGYISI